MNKLYGITFGLLSMTALLQAAVVDIELDITVAVQNCTGAGSTCTQRIGSARKVFRVQITKAPIVLKAIMDDFQKVALPTADNDVILYSLKPTTGDSAGKTILIAFHKEVPEAGSTLEGRNPVAMWRKIEGVTDWFNASNIVSPTPLAELSYRILPSGDLVAPKNPRTGKSEVLELGKLQRGDVLLKKDETPIKKQRIN